MWHQTAPSDQTRPDYIRRFFTNEDIRLGQGPIKSKVLQIRPLLIDHPPLRASSVIKHATDAWFEHQSHHSPDWLERMLDGKISYAGKFFACFGSCDWI